MTDSMIRYVGLDVHKRVVEACLVDQAGQVVHRERFALSRHTLGLFATKVLRPTDQVALEVTTNCWAVAEVLRGQVARVVVSNPMATKAIALAKVKTDKVDAHVLAQLLRCDYLPEVWQPDEATQRLRELTGRRSTLVGQRTRLRNRIHAVLAMRLIETPAELFNAEGLAWLTSQSLDDQARILVDADQRQMEFVQQQIDALDLELARRAYAGPDAKLLMTLPGVDVATAQSLLAAWGSAKRFSDGAHAASYLGLVPSTKQSADRCYHGPITKRGNTQARWMLIEAAQHLDKHPGPLGHFFRRLLKKKHRNVAVVAAARKLAVIGWQMLVTNEPYRYAIPHATEAKLSRLRVRVTGQRRVGGAPKGQKALPLRPGQPGGSRTLRSLPEVCQSEGLPAPRPLSAGEQRTVADAGCQTLVEQLAHRQILPRRTAAAAQAPLATADKGRVIIPRTSSPASCEAFRRHRAADQGDEAPPPGLPTLFSIPKLPEGTKAKHTNRKSHTPS